jgi:exodeoxyribonuclease V alpha subunit
MPPSAQDSPVPYRYQTQESLKVVVERITYHAEQSGYTVARIQSPRARELVTVVGNFANIQAGQTPFPLSNNKP